MLNSDGTREWFVFTDRAGCTWHMLERADGSVCVYYTLPYNPFHFVVFDTLEAG